MTARGDRNLRQALAYARHGWPVFPVVSGQKIPATPRGSATDLQAGLAEVTETPGRLGLSSRSYRDPRFAARRQALQDTPTTRDERHE